MMCIVFKLNMCLGCNALEHNVDEVKQFCETYKDFIGGGTDDKSRRMERY